VPANLLVTNVVLPPVNFSGESITIRYTITNVGAYPVWQDTRSWRDFLWLSADPSFIRERASYLGQTTHVQQTPLQAGRELRSDVHHEVARGHRRRLLPVHRPRRPQRPVAAAVPLPGGPGAPGC